MNSITSRRNAKIVGAALAASVVLAACGGSGNASGSGSSAKAGAKTPSALDPANMVPASSLAYVSAEIRPQGSVKSDLIEAVDSIAGNGTAQRLGAKLDKSLGKKLDLAKGWVGQRVGVAITALPADLTGGAAAFENEVLLVFPTSDPAAARAYLSKTMHNPNETWNVIGNYAIVGGKAAVGQAEITTAKTSLAAEAGYQADMATLGNNELFSFYASLHQFYEALVPILQNDPAYTASALKKTEKELPPGSSVALGMSALPNQFRMDLVSHGLPTASAPTSAAPSDVSSLPGSSWLALTLGGALARAGTVKTLAANFSKELATIKAASGKVGGALPNGPLEFVERDLLPALGPAELSVSGTSKHKLRAGLVISPDNKSAGARLAGAIKRLVGGLPISARTSGGRVAVTFGISSLQQLLSPSSTLADNPTFKQALTELPAGSKADIYLNFAPLTLLASLDHSSNSRSTMKVLHRLDYLIAGGNHSHFRLVLTTH